MIRSNDQPAGADVAPGSTLNPGDEATAGTPGTGEDVCRHVKARGAVTASHAPTEAARAG